MSNISIPKLLLVWSKSCKGSSYLQIALNCIPPDQMEVVRVFINDYPTFDDSGYDFLLYNTFSDETHEFKFDWEPVLKSDEKYYRFKGKKLLIDSDDRGYKDGFERFNDRTLPRIKYTPGYEFMKEFNVVMGVPIKVRWYHVYRREEKTIPIIYTGVKEPFAHTIRRDVANRVVPFGAYMRRHRSAVDAGRLLRQAKISICVPGWGPMGSAHAEALAAKAVMFSHEWVKKVKLLPFGELEDDVNYVSFTMENLEDRLSQLLKDEDRIKSVAEKGHKLFNIGYSPQRTGMEIMNYFMDKK